MNITTIPGSRGARHRRKRVGRGIGSGHGKTATRGTKGQRARTGSRKHPGFEGGRNPLIRSIPKRGFKDKGQNRLEAFEVVNVGRLEGLAAVGAGEKLTLQRLKDLGIVKSGKRVKLLGDGELKKKITVSVHAASASALQKVEKAGGKVELVASGRTGTGS